MEDELATKEELKALEDRLLDRIEVLERKVRQLQDEEGIDQKVL